MTRLFSKITKPMHYIKSFCFSNCDLARWHDATFSFQVGTQHLKQQWMLKAKLYTFMPVNKFM